MIKCPVCSRFYSYGRKITHLCEGSTYFFGSIFNETTPKYQWNCIPHPIMPNMSIISHDDVSLSTEEEMEDRFELTCNNENSKILYPWNCRFNQNIVNILLTLSIADKQLIYE